MVEKKNKKMMILNILNTIMTGRKQVRKSEMCLVNSNNLV